MERVVRKRKLPKWPHYTAVPNCKFIGRHVLASVNGSQPLDFLISDCAQSRDYKQQIREHLLLEVDYKTAKEVGMLQKGRAPAIVYDYR